MLTSTAQTPTHDSVPSVDLPALPKRSAPVVSRLLVLIPDADTDEGELARQLWQVAHQSALPMVLVSLLPDALHESQTRRRLANLTALIQDRQIKVETRLLAHSNWLSAL